MFFSVSLMAMFTIGMFGYLLGPLLPALQTSLGLNFVAAGALLTVQSAGGFLGAVGGGLLADRLGKKPVILAGAAMMALGCVAFSSARGLSMVVTALVAIGIGFGAVDGGASAALTQRYKRRSGAVLNLADSIFDAGALVGPLIVTILLKEPGDFRRTFVAILALPMILLVWTGLTKFPAALGGENGSTPSPGDGAPFTSAPWEMIRRPAFFGMALFLFFYLGVEVGFSGWMVTILGRAHGMSLAAGGRLLSLFWLMMAVGRLLASRIAVKAPLRRLLLISTAGAVFFLTLAAVASSTTLTIISFPLTGLFLAPLFPTSLALGAQSCPGNPGLANGLLIGAGTVGSVILPFLMGVAADRYGLVYALAVTIASLLMMLAVLLFVRSPRRQATNAGNGESGTG